MFIVRATTVGPVKAGFVIWTILNPLPKIVSSDNRTLYVVFIPQISNGTAPYSMTVTIGVNGGPDDTYMSARADSSTGFVPVIWSEAASHSATTLKFQLLVTDSSLSPTTSYVTTTLHIPGF
jgi:hypothetical protein